MWRSYELRIAAEQQVEVEAFMRIQLEDRGFQLVYQPLYAISGQVEGLEALLRLSHPDYGPISPGRFIPLAEETGLIIPIGTGLSKKCAANWGLGGTKAFGRVQLP